MAYPVAQPAPVTKGRGLIIAGVVMVVLGVVVGIVGLILISQQSGGFVALVEATPISTPYSGSQVLTAGENTVYENTSDGSSVVPADVTVVAPDGTSVVVGNSSIQQPISIRGQQYSSVANFTAPKAGQYTITIKTPNASVIIGPSVLAAIKQSIGGLSAMGGGAFVFVVGLVLLIVGLVRRSKSRRAQIVYPQPLTPYGQQVPPAPTAYAPPAAPPVAPVPPAPPVPVEPVVPEPPVEPGPPAGWYPDPDQPGGRRYWDGSTWTDHRG